MAIEIKITPEMKAKFAAETAEHLDLFEEMLLKLESGPFDQDCVNKAFRAVHSIKGNSDYIGVKDINDLANALEDLLDAIRKQDIEMTPETIPVLLDGLDTLRAMNLQITREDYQQTDISRLLHKIDDIKIALPARSLQPEPIKRNVDVMGIFTKTSAQHIEYLNQQAKVALSGSRSKKIRDNVLRILRTFFISANYAGVDAVSEKLKKFESKVRESKTFGKRLAGILVKELDTIAETVRGLQKENAAPDSAHQMTEAVTAELSTMDMRLPPHRADELMSHVTELLIAVSGLNYSTDRITAGHVSTEQVEALQRTVKAVNRAATRTHLTTQAIRLVRMDTLFGRLPRIVRDLSAKSGKKIDISMMGGKTEIDRKVIEKLVDPLIHLIRNAVDHGIELPDDRERKSKPASGAITVKAFQESNQVVVDVIDDGKGIDIEKIKAEAQKGDFVDTGVLDEMKPDEVLNLVFKPGFTTADTTSSVSGRGVGLDIVSNNLKAVGGNVTLSSEKGRATRFRLQVPMSLAAVEVLLVEAEGEPYAIPIACIVETMNISPKNIQVINNAEMITHKDDLITAAYLTAMLDLSPKKQIRMATSTDALQMVVISFGGRLKGLVVDRLLKQESIIIKPLAKNLSSIDEFSGAALMGDGSIVLVLDPQALVLD
ncbi:MAG: hypothetical protein DRH24_04195 [Deltaproteobacteria bacterium]|nr:MAG: hypothetical protein DRH24_04195 [Deltaproteobacteria bacterium]